MSLTSEIKALIKKGDATTTQAEAHYKAAGQKLIQLRAEKTKREFEKVVSKECGIQISWAYTLIRMAKGKTTLAKERTKTNTRIRAIRKKRTVRTVQNPEAAPEGDEQGDTPQQRWEYSVGNMAGEAISLQPYWDKHFEGWQDYPVASQLVTLAQQAADAWVRIADELTTRAGAIPMRRTSHGD